MEATATEKTHFKVGQIVTNSAGIKAVLAKFIRHDQYSNDELWLTMDGRSTWVSPKTIKVIGSANGCGANLTDLPDLTDNDDWKALERAASRSIPGDKGVIAKCLLDVREYLNSIVKYLESKE